MGLMLGKVHEHTMIVMDAFALPVEGTETRVNAQAEGYEYMVDYVMKIKEVRTCLLYAEARGHNLTVECARWVDKRMLSGGITVIQATAAGYRE
jgi:hypothetical protein